MLGPKARSSSCPCNPGRPQAASGVGLPAEVDSDGPSAPREGQPGLRGSRGGGAAPLGSMTSRNGQGIVREQNPANNRLSGARTPRGALWSGPDCEVLAREPTKPNSREGLGLPFPPPAECRACPGREVGLGAWRRPRQGPWEKRRSLGPSRVSMSSSGGGEKAGSPQGWPKDTWVSRRVRLWDLHTGGATPRPPNGTQASCFALLIC